MTATRLTATPTAGGRRDVRGRLASVQRPVVGRGGDVRGRFTADTGPGGGSGGDVWGRLAVSTAGAWSLYSLAAPTLQGHRSQSC
jgi:hypothetical protein